MNPKLWNFAPLMVWTVFFITYTIADEYFSKYSTTKDQAEGQALVLFGGSFFWFLVACYLNS